MGNPQSLSWAFETWGYTLFGVATWLLAPLFRQPGLERVTATLLIVNGIMGLIGGVLTAADMGWAMTVPGMVSHVAWDGLIAAMAAALIWSLHRRLTVLRRSTSPPAA